VTTLTYQKTLNLVVVECYSCTIQYGIPASLNKMLLDKRSNATTYCPNGHGWCYTGQTAEERVRAAEARATHADDQRQAAERRVTAYKGQLTKVKNRVANGVCPCCSRTFVNLARHMAGRHPDFTTEPGP
jgi:hypothetical protein